MCPQGVPEILFEHNNYFNLLRMVQLEFRTHFVVNCKTYVVAIDR